MNGKYSLCSKTISPRRRLVNAAQNSKKQRRLKPRVPAAPRPRWELRVNNPLLKRAVAELVGTALLLAAVVGSGIMGERLAAGNTAMALLADTTATRAALVALILTFGPISGAHFNAAVTLHERK